MSLVRLLRPAPEGGVLLDLRVTPKAAHNAIDGIYRASDGAVSLKVKITTAPEKGKANKAVIALLASTLRLAKNRFALVAGETARNKTLLISGDMAAIAAALGAALGKDGKEGQT